MSELAEQMTSVLPTLILWAGASLVAVMLLAKSVSRRRALLTDSLKNHVVAKVGTSDHPPSDDAASKT